MILYRIYQLLIVAPTLLVATILSALLTITGSMAGLRWFTYYPAHYWAKIFCWLNIVRVTVKGRDNVDRQKSYVFVANHQGAFDIFAVYGFLGHDFKWMMKQSLRNIPLVGYSCYKAGHIFVDHRSPAAVKRTMENAERSLKGGASLVVFPEGARSRDGHMRPFKKGAYQLALEFRLPLVPVSINGAYDVMPRSSWLPKWGHIILTIHQPIEAPHDEEGRVKVMDETARTIKSALPERFR